MGFQGFSLREMREKAVEGLALGERAVYALESIAQSLTDLLNYLERGR
jgi:hypothetical protein